MAWSKISVPLFSAQKSCSWRVTELSSGESCCVCFNYTTPVAPAQTDLCASLCCFTVHHLACFPVRFPHEHVVFTFPFPSCFFSPASSFHPRPRVPPSLIFSFVLLTHKPKSDVCFTFPFCDPGGGQCGRPALTN